VALTAAEMRYFVSLNTKKGRKQQKQFLAEGVRLLEEALAGDYLPCQVMYAPSEINPRGQELIEAFTARKIETRSISARECGRLSDTESSQGILALFDLNEPELEQQLRRGTRKVLVCDRIGDPGNLGTLIRSAAALGFGLVVTTAGSAEVAAPKTIRSSAGAFFRIPIVGGVDEAELVTKLSDMKYEIFAADIRGEDISGIPTVLACSALIIGSEAEGFSPLLSSRAQHHIRIPMSPGVESLNAAMAGTILMYWLGSFERT
jgi:TrmH family RNA methyltransferase